MNRNYDGKVPTEMLAVEYAAGATLEDIGKTHGISKQAVWQRFVTAGILRRPKRGTPKRSTFRVPPHVCPGCGKEFRPSERRVVCCSRACRKAHRAICRRGHPRIPGALYRGRCRKCLYLNTKAYRARKRRQRQIAGQHMAFELFFWRYQAHPEFVEEERRNRRSMTKKETST